MAYMWDEFNIKPFNAETIVYRDGVFIPQLSTIDNGPINKNYDLPVHIIYVGEIIGDKIINIDVNVENQPVFFSVNIKNKNPAFFKIFIKNTGKNSNVTGHVLLDNYSEIDYECNAGHFAKNTGIFVKNKLIANKNSISRLTGVTDIKNGCNDCQSDISFSAIADKTAKIEFLPAQYISSAPLSADHSASIFKPTDAQITYLRQAGIGSTEIPSIIRDAFINDF